MLQFLDYEDAGEGVGRSSDLFQGSLQFGRRLEIESLVNCSRPQANALVDAWQSEHPDVLDTLTRRYREVKELGKRILRERKSAGAARGAVDPASREADTESASGQQATAGTTPPRPARGPSIRAGQKVGPNAPCPCGSGRKYKKCCMRR